MTAKHTFNFATAAFAIMAALLWFASARVNSGNKFTEVGFPISMLDEAEKLNELGAAYNLQSRLNAFAASFAGLSALCQAVVVWIDW